MKQITSKKCSGSDAGVSGDARGVYGWLKALNRILVEKGVWKKLCALELSALVGLGAAECILRLYASRSCSPLFIERNAPVEMFLQRFRIRPGSIIFESRTNSFGYLDDQEFVVGKTEGKKRIISIADSFAVMSVPCRYHFATKAETDNWEIYNIGVICTDPQEYLYLLKTEAIPLKPDLGYIF